MTALLWLRRDLRLHDNPALIGAAAEGESLAACFCLDDRLLYGRNSSPARVQFMLESLAQLAGQLQERGSALAILHGRPEQQLPRFAAGIGARSLHLSADPAPYAQQRDQAVRAACGQLRLKWREYPGSHVVDDPAALRTGAGKPFAVFTPFLKRWRQLPRRAVLPAPERLPAPPDGMQAGAIPSLAKLGMRSTAAAARTGGERPARLQMERFLSLHIEGYAASRDFPGQEGASGLSPYLRFGCISARELEHASMSSRGGAQEFRRQLAWRDFFAHVLACNPDNRHQEQQQRYRGTIAWNDDQEAFTAWCRGMTGYPLLDAAMRQLLSEGHIHNRPRMLCGSFLTKQLGIDWRRGASWFMHHLLDGDEASNNGNWQWVASVGADPQPVFKRLLSPMLQQRRFDPTGAYVRAHVPELASVPDRLLATPWQMSSAEQLAAGCHLGVDYPLPIVDNLLARYEALERYRLAGS